MLPGAGGVTEKSTWQKARAIVLIVSLALNVILVLTPPRYSFVATKQAPEVATALGHLQSAHNSGDNAFPLPDFEHPHCPDTQASAGCYELPAALSALGPADAPLQALVGPGIPAAPQARSMTAVLTVFKRSYLERQLVSAEANTIAPTQVLVYQTGDFSPESKSLLESRPDIGHVQAKSFIPGVWPGVFGGFALALQASGENTCILDDDVIPLPRWFETVDAAIGRYGPHTVVGCSGRMVNFDKDASGAVFVTGFDSAPGRPTDETDVPADVFVDFPVHCFCARTDFFQHYWGTRKYPVWWTGEDIHMGAVARQLGGRVVVPAQRRADGTLGDNCTALGADTDLDAVPFKPGHADIRVELAMHWISRGWRPLRWPENATAVSTGGAKIVTGTILRMRWAEFPPQPQANATRHDETFSGGDTQMAGGGNVAGTVTPSATGASTPSISPPSLPSPAAASRTVCGHWSSLPVTVTSTWVPGSESDTDERELLVTSRSDAARLLSGRNISFLGDSLSRWQYYSAVAWLHGCMFWTGQGYDTDPLPGLTEGQRARACDDVERVIGAAAMRHNQLPHRTVVPAGEGRQPLVLSYWWNAYTRDLYTPGNKTASPAYGQPPYSPTAPELLCESLQVASSQWLVMNSGLWHLRVPREALDCNAPTPHEDFDALFAENRALIEAVTAAANAAGIDARKHVLWRGLPLIERQFGPQLFHGCWNNTFIGRAGRETDALWRDAGFPVLSMAKYHAGIPADPEAGPWITTIDGFHPNAVVMVHAFKEVATALLRRQGTR